MNNKKTSGVIIQSFAAAWLLSLALFTLSFVLKTGVPVITHYILGALIIIIAVAFAKGGFYYIEIDTEDDVFRIKFFNLFPMGREYKALEIPWERYYKHEITTKYRGIFHYLNIFEKTGRGIAKYPSIGISALKKKERETLVAFFQKMEKTKKR